MSGRRAGKEVSLNHRQGCLGPLSKTYVMLRIHLIESHELTASPVTMSLNSSGKKNKSKLGSCSADATESFVLFPRAACARLSRALRPVSLHARARFLRTLFKDDRAPT